MLRSQLNKAHDAVESDMREHGSSHAHLSSSGSSSGASADVKISGSGTIIGGTRLKGSIIGHSEGHYAMLISGDGLVCSSALKHAPGTVASELASIHCTNGAHGLATVKKQRHGTIANFSLRNGDTGWVIFN